MSLAHNHPTTRSVLAVITLALVCTGLAFVVFFKLLDEIGPARAPLITFANPVVAVALGAILLDEAVTLATVVGFVLVMTGCWLATRRAPHQRIGVTTNTRPSPTRRLRRYLQS